MKTPQVRSSLGFTLVEVMIVVAIIGFVSAIAIPNFLRMRIRAQTNTCIENLRQIDAAKQMFGVEKGRKPGALIADSDLFGPTLYLKAKPICPAGGEINVNSIGTNTSCSIEGHVLK